MDHNLLRLFLCVLLPGVLSAGVSLLNQRSSFGRLPYAVRQITIGVCFGGLAVLFTEFGINIGSATINVRDAAPLCAGLLFGGPAGIIAGVIGGVERWFAALWGAGEFTRTACSAATILAGLLGAAVRRFLLDGKRPSWGYGAMVGVTIEVLHMLLVLLTNMEELQAAFYVVERCTVIMTLANALSITLAIGVTALLENRQAGGRPKNRKKKISEIVQARLLICIAIAFVLTSFFTYSVQSTIAGNSTDYYLSQSIMDIPTSIHNTSESLMLQYTRWIGSDIDSGRREGAAGETLYEALAKEYEILELYIVDRDGKVTYSLNRAFIGFNLAEEEQTAEFLPILSGKTDDCILEYQPSFPNPKVFRQYVGVALEDGGLVLVGYDKVLIEEFDVHISTTAKNRHVGQDGFVLLADRNGTIVSDGLEENGQSLEEAGLSLANVPPDRTFRATVHGIDAYCRYSTFSTAGGEFRAIAVLPADEVLFTRNIALYITIFMEVLVFVALYFLTYFLLKKLVVRNVERITGALERITGGDLDLVVDVRANAEFDSLSDGINSTVHTLKRYIAEAAARLDQELEYAKTIQHAALPSVFPPYPERSSFDIFAYMDAAKEVGGDFYDFYLLGKQQLVFLIADVSGKGIPAAMFMMRAKTLIKSLTEANSDPAEAFTRANEKLCAGNDAGMFVTAWMGILDLCTGQLRYVNAGHNPPILRRGGGEYEYLRTRPNFILAGMEGARYRLHALQLEPGDEIFLYTDGVTEALNPSAELYTEDRLLRLFHSGRLEGLAQQEMVRAIRQDISDFADGAEQADDITMLTLKFNEREADNG